MFCRNLLLCAALLLGTAGSAAAALPADLDWSAWQQMPVFERGRLMPLDTFARHALETICGSTSPRLSLAGAAPEGEGAAPELAAAGELFPGGKPRRFTAAELLFSWTVEPEKWEHVPFLIAEHEQLRKDLLGLPIVDRQGNRLKHVSPRQVENAPRLRQRLRELAGRQWQAEAKRQRLELAGVDKKVKALFDAYTLFGLLTFKPDRPAANRARFYDTLAEAVQAWRGLEADLQHLQGLDAQGGSESLVGQTGSTLKQLADLSRREDFKLAEVEPLLVALGKSTAGLAELYAQSARRFSRDPPAWDEDQLRRSRTVLNTMAGKTAELARLAGDAHRALYDNGQSLRLVPALNPAALEANRNPADESQPWLNLQTLIAGSEELMSPYPQPELVAVRQAFQQVASVYVDRGNLDRTERFAAAMERFAGAVRALGYRIEPLRRQLPIQTKDEALIAATAYPPPGFTKTELRYNQLDPFFWSWLINLAAVACFALSFGVVRKPMFWLGILILGAGQILTCYGFALRTCITGWAPVTNMFETVVFVALVAALLGLWFTLLPVLWPGLKSAWRLTAAPGTWEAAPLAAHYAALLKPHMWSVGGWVLLVPRAYLMYLVVRLLALQSYGSGQGHTVISLLPRTDVGSSVPTANDLLTWAVGLGVLVPTVWYVPRAVLAVAGSLATVPYGMFRLGLSRPLKQVLQREPFAVVGAAVAFLVALIAYNFPLQDKGIGSLMPVLRDNFWLTLHVLTITASYGAGALAWGLGDIALVYYLFGRYRDSGGNPAWLAAQGHRPAGGFQAHPEAVARRAPEACATLGGFIYKATQGAVVLLAAGTILGALWADVAWGRFWGWDAKEVWALISLLVYLVFLHGRYAGWFGNFGLAAGSVLGASAIIMAWYGVNYYLRSGLHTYAEGAGGQWQVFFAVLCNWIFLAAAWVRYRLETHKKR